MTSSVKIFRCFIPRVVTGNYNHLLKKHPIDFDLLYRIKKYPISKIRFVPQQLETTLLPNGTLISTLLLMLSTIECLLDSRSALNLESALYTIQK
jgi:hypothetical protein